MRSRVHDVLSYGGVPNLVTIEALRAHACAWEAKSCIVESCTLNIEHVLYGGLVPDAEKFGQKFLARLRILSTTFSKPTVKSLERGSP